MLRADSALPIRLAMGESEPSTATVDGNDGASRRIEDWIVGTLVDRDSPAGLDDRREVFDRISPGRRGVRSQDNPSGPGGWARFRVRRRRGITVIALSDSALIKENELAELAGDLTALVEAGHRRIVLNFAAVERLSIWAIGPVADLLDRCKASGEGALKVCGLRPLLSEIFEISGLGREVAIFEDESSAIDSPWGDPPTLQPLPVDVLRALLRGADGPPTASFGAPGHAGPPRAPIAAPPTEGLPAMSAARLIRHHGPSEARSVEVAPPRFVIGRDRSCQLRLGTPSVSRFHAAIEHRHGRLFLRDLASTNGTLVNGLPLRDAEVEIRDGDRIRIAGLELTLAVPPGSDIPSAIEDQIAGWVRARGETPTGADGATIEDYAVPEEADDPPAIRHEVIEGVLVVTPMIADLGGEAEVAPVRTGLDSLFVDARLPRRVVVNLAHVGQLSGRAIGVLLVHHLRLDHAGGALRVCEAPPRVAAAIEQVRLSMLIGCHATIDDAVLTAWPQAPAREASLIC